VEGRIGTQRERNGVSNDEPRRNLLVVARGGERIDLVLDETRDIVAMFGDQLAGDQEGPCLVTAIHVSRIASTHRRFHRITLHRRCWHVRDPRLYSALI